MYQKDTVGSHFKFCVHSLVLDTDDELTVNLTAPQVIQEGQSFFPSVQVSLQIDATFRVSTINGSAHSSVDFGSFSEGVEFITPNIILNTRSAVVALSDNLVEPDETFQITIALDSPSKLQPFVRFGNQPVTVTITDNNSEFGLFRHCFQ